MCSVSLSSRGVVGCVWGRWRRGGRSIRALFQVGQYVRYVSRFSLKTTDHVTLVSQLLLGLLPVFF